MEPTQFRRICYASNHKAHVPGDRYGVCVATATVRAAEPAPEAQPATQPTSQPTSRPARIPIPADETPLGAMRRGAAVYDQLDLGYAMELFDYSTPEEKQFIKTQCEYAIALTAVEHAIKERFGKAASDSMLHAVDEHTVEDCEKAKIEVEDDKATVQFAGENDPSFTLVHIDGIWRISAHDAMEDLDAETIKGINESEAEMTRALPDIEKDVRDGKYKTAEDATAAVKKVVSPDPAPPEPEVPTQKA